MALRPGELERAGIVAEDLAHLADEWTPELNLRALRVLSTVLRRLLIYGDYKQAWRSVGLPGQPTITITDLDAMLGAIDRTLIDLAFAPPSEVIADAMRAGGHVHLKTPEAVPPKSLLILVFGEDQNLGPIYMALPDENVSKVFADPGAAASDRVREHLGSRVERQVTVTELLRSPAVLIRNARISRKEVISYIVEKAGGAHFDTTRNRKGDDRLALLDRQPLEYEPFGQPSVPFVYTELLSIASALGRSDDAARFCDAYEQATKQ